MSLRSNLGQSVEVLPSDPQGVARPVDVAERLGHLDGQEGIAAHAVVVPDYAATSFEDALALFAGAMTWAHERIAPTTPKR